MARIDDLVYVDDLTKHSDQVMSISKVGVIAHKSVGIPYSLPISSSPYKTAFTTPSFSPARLITPAKAGERSPYLDGNKLPPRGFGVKKVLTDYLSIDPRGKDCSGKVERSDSFSSLSIDTRGRNSSCKVERSDSSSSMVREASTSHTGIGSSQCSSEPFSPRIQDSVWEE